MDVRTKVTELFLAAAFADRDHRVVSGRGLCGHNPSFGTARLPELKKRRDVYVIFAFGHTHNITFFSYLFQKYFIHYSTVIST